MIFQDLTENKRQKFQLAANRLLNNCYVLKNRYNDDFYFILQNFELFEEYFDVLGYKIAVSDRKDFVALSNGPEGGRIRLKKMESIVLLILRLLYIDKKQQLSESEEIIIKVEDFYEKFGILKLKQGLDRTSLRDILSVLRRFNLIDIIDRDLRKDDARIQIYPTIYLALSNENINEMQKLAEGKLKTYNTQSEEIDEATEENTAD